MAIKSGLGTSSQSAEQLYQSMLKDLMEENEQEQSLNGEKIEENRRKDKEYDEDKEKRRKRTKAAVRKVLLKKLGLSLSDRRAEAATDELTKLTEESDVNARELLKNLSQTSESIDKKVYRQIVDKLLSKDAATALQILENAKDDSMHTNEDSGDAATEINAIRAIKTSNNEQADRIASALAKLPLVRLEERYTQIRSALASEKEDETNKQLLGFEAEKIERAIIARTFKNYEIVYEYKNKNNATNLINSLPEATKEKIKWLNDFNNASSGATPSQEAEKRYATLLEEVRIDIENLPEEGQGEEVDIGEHTKEHYGVIAFNKLKEANRILPESEKTRIRRLAGEGDIEALKAYYEMTKPEGSSEEPSEDDLITHYALSASELEREELDRFGNPDEVIANISEEQTKKLAEVLNKELDGQNDTEILANALKEQHKKYKESIEVQGNGSAAMAEYLENASALLDSEMKRALSQSSDKAVISRVRFELMEEAINNGGRLDWHMVRQRFNYYDYPGLDFSNPRSKAFLKAELRKVGSHNDDEINEIIEKFTEAQKNGSAYSLLMEMEEKLKSNKIDSNALELYHRAFELISSPISYHGNDANGEPIFSYGTTEIATLMKEIKSVMGKNKEIESWLKANEFENPDSEGFSRVHRYALANMLLVAAIKEKGLDQNKVDKNQLSILINTFQTKCASASTYAELLNSAREILGEDSPLSKKISETTSYAEQRKADEEDLEVQLKNITRVMFDIKQGPGGIYLHTTHPELIKNILGFDPDDEQYGDVKGFTIPKEFTLKLPNDQNISTIDFPGYIAVVDSYSRSHELQHILEMGMWAEEDNDYARLGLDEIVARLRAEDYIDVFKEANSLAELGIDTSKLEDIEKQNLAEVVAMLKIIAKNIGKEEQSRPSPDEIVAQELLREILIGNGNNLENIKQEIRQSWENEFEDWQPNNVNIDTNTNYQANTSKIKFFSRVAGSPGAGFTRAGQKDTPPLTNQVYNSFANHGNHLKSKITMMDTISGPSKYSYWNMDRQLTVFGDGPITNVTLNPLANLAIKLIYKPKMHEFRDAFASPYANIFGVNIGKWLGLDFNRPSSPANRRGYLHPLGRIAQERHGEFSPGQNEKYKYVGHVHNEAIRLSNVDDNYFSILKTVGMATTGKASQGQVTSLLAKTKFGTVSDYPGERPQPHPQMNAEKADRISDLFFRRARTEALNFYNDLNDRHALYDTEANRFVAEPVSYSLKDPDDKEKKLVEGEVKLDKNGNIMFYPKGKKDPVPFTENEIANLAGRKSKKALNKVGASFYKSYRPAIVEWEDGKHYFLHYDPRTGLPGLYEQEYIDWTGMGKKKKVPEPVKDKNGMNVLPDHAWWIQMKERGTERYALDMDAATTGLFNRIIEARETTRNYLEEKFSDNYDPRALYSLGDLVRSVQMYEQMSPVDGKFVKNVKTKVWNGIEFEEESVKKIFIPYKDRDKDGNEVEKFHEVDYNVALNLLNRLGVYDISDNMRRKGWVKGMSPQMPNPEYIQTDSVRRDTFRRYIAILMDDDAEHYNKVAVNNPTAPYHVQRLDRANFGSHKFDNDYFMSKEGTAELLRYLEEDVSHKVNSMPNNSREEAIEILRVRMDKYAEIEDYEGLLYDGQTSMIDNTDADEASKRARREMLINTVDAALDTEKSKVLNDMRDTLANNKYGQNYNKLTARQQKEITQKAWETIIYDDNLPGGRNDPRFDSDSLGGYIVNRFFRREQPRSVATTGAKGLYINTVSGIQAITGTVNNVDTALGNEIGAMYNNRYDGRALEILMEDKTMEEVDRIANEFTANTRDMLKFRQEARDYTIRAMEMATMLEGEFNRYRRAKYVWETIAKQTKRINTVMFFAAIALIMTGNPLGVYMLLGSIGYAKLALPLLDLRTGISVNRRNFAREMYMKASQHADQVRQLYEKGETLTEQQKKDLDAQYLDFTLMAGEETNNKGKPDGWKPGKNFGIDSFVNVFFDQQGGLVPRALAA